jgi:ferrous iron transport protein A
MASNSTPLFSAMQLPLGTIGVIGRLSNCSVSLKLLEMGCLPGKELEILRVAPFGSPLYLRVGSQFLALRPEEASRILVTKR